MTIKCEHNVNQVTLGRDTLSCEEWISVSVFFHIYNFFFTVTKM